MLRDEIRLNEHEEVIVIEAKRAIHDVMNRYAPNAAKALAWEMAHDHRTLVQTAMRDFVLPFIDYLAEQGSEGRFDARNEGSVKLAMALHEVASSRNDILLPFI